VTTAKHRQNTDNELLEMIEGAQHQLERHQVLSNIETLQAREIQAILLQRRFVSLAFTPFYDVAIDALDADRYENLEGARIVLRYILREEYPNSVGNEKSHREFLVDDLVQFGLTRREILTSRPTVATSTVIHESFEQLRDAYGNDVALLGTVMTYGEFLVRVEYQSVMKAWPSTVSREKSVFYRTHIGHDQGHANRLLELLPPWIHDDAQLESFSRTIQRCVDMKKSFYDQFQ